MISNLTTNVTVDMLWPMTMVMFWQGTPVPLFHNADLGHSVLYFHKTATREIDTAMVTELETAGYEVQQTLVDESMVP